MPFTLLDKRKTCSACGGIGHNKRTCTEVPYKVTQEAVAAEILPRTSRAKKRPTFHDEFLDDPLRHQKKQSGGRMAARTGIQQQPRQQQQQEEKEHKLKQKQQQKLKQKQAIETANVTFDAEVDDAEEIFTSSRFVGVEWNPQEKMWQASVSHGDTPTQSIGLFEFEEEAARQFAKYVAAYGFT